MSRDQFSLFVTGADGERLDRLRRELDPVQAALIPAHLTLCREDELAGLEGLGARLAAAAPLRLRFGPPERFDGHGILLRCVEGQTEYDALRRHLLGRPDARHADAHLTLAHPRNPQAAGSRWPIPSLADGLALTLADLRWIRQTSPQQPWQTLARWTLGQAPR